MLSDFYKIKTILQKNIESLIFNEIKELKEKGSEEKLVIIKKSIEDISLVQDKENNIHFNLKDNILVIKHTIKNDIITYNHDLTMNAKNIKIDKIDLKNLDERQSITKINKIQGFYYSLYEYFKMSEFIKSGNFKNLSDIINQSDEINKLAVLKNRDEDKYYSLNVNLKALNDFLNMDKDFYLSLFNEISNRENTIQKEITIKNHNTRFHYKHNIRKNIITKEYNYCNYDNESIDNVLNEAEKTKIEKNKKFIFETLEEVSKIINFDKYNPNKKIEFNNILELQWKKFNKNDLIKRPKI